MAGEALGMRSKAHTFASKVTRAKICAVPGRCIVRHANGGLFCGGPPVHEQRMDVMLRVAEFESTPTYVLRLPLSLDVEIRLAPRNTLAEHGGIKESAGLDPPIRGTEPWSQQDYPWAEE
jgi:hypothetical protein